MIKKIGYSAIEQGVFSAINFLFNIFLARYLTASLYGEFAITFSIYLFCLGIYNALFLEPMSVLGAKLESLGFIRYKANVVCLSLTITLLFLVVGIGTSYFGVPYLGGYVFLGFSLMMVYNLIRRIYYVEEKTREILLLSTTLFVLFIIMMVCMNQYFLESLTDANSIFFFLSIPYMIICAFYLIKNTGLFSHFNAFRSIVLIKKNWNFGSWLVATSLLYWLSESFYIPLIGYFSGQSEVGAFQALKNLTYPLNQVIAGISLYFLPVISKRIESSRLKAQKIHMIYGFISFVYLVFILLLDEEIISILYDNEQLLTFTWMLFFLCAASFIESIKQSTSLFLVAYEKTKFTFISRLVGVILTFSIGLYLIYSFGIVGTLSSYVITVFGVAITTYYFYRKIRA